MTVRDYSTTANDNITINGITLADTMLANALDNAIRQAMADTANFLLDIAKPTASTGSSNAYILTTGGTVDAYADKIRLAFRANFSNTGACTINVDTVGVVNLKVYTSEGIDDPAAGQIQSGGVYDIIYVSSLGDFVVLNPSIFKDTSWKLVESTYDFSVDGAVASVESAAFADNFEYMFVFLDLSSSSTAAKLKIDLYKETDAAYHGSPGDSSDALGAADDDLFGFAFLEFSRLSSATKLITCFTNEDANTSTGADTATNMDQENYSQLVNLATAQKIGKAKFSWSFGNIDAGVINMYRKGI